VANDGNNGAFFNYQYWCQPRNEMSILQVDGESLVVLSNDRYRCRHVVDRSTIVKICLSSTPIVLSLIFGKSRVLYFMDEDSSKVKELVGELKRAGASNFLSMRYIFVL
jgi:hypothetical protein